MMVTVPALALVLTVVWIVAVAGIRGVIGYRRTGEVAIRGRDRAGTPQWWARLLSVIGVILAIAAPVAALNGFEPLRPLEHTAAHLVGLALVAFGIVGTLVAQWAMGDAWRGDVDPEARTPLVTTGPFRFVRNPIFTATAATAFGLALLVPNVLALGMLVAFLASLQIQVRLVEEPYLRRVHGVAYQRYAARTGRFLPRIGRT